MYPCRKVIKDRAKRGVTGGLETPPKSRYLITTYDVIAKQTAIVIVDAVRH